MKIVYILISAYYKEGYGYQENILSAKHKQLGYDVTLITYDRFKAFGELKADSKGVKSYVNNKGIKVIVLPDNDSFLTKIPLWVFNKCLNKTKFLYETLCEEAPDIIFVHGIDASDHEIVVKYKNNNPCVKIYVDNHADFYNSPIDSLSRIISRKIIGRRYVQHLTNVCERIWGVTPWRVDYLKKVYGISGEKVGLLVMGGDESLINWENRSSIRSAFRKKFGIPEDAFVVVSGGKIDEAKNIHLLIDAVKSINNRRLYLVVFGNYCDTLKSYANDSNPHIVNIGWIPSDDVYNIFLSSDLGAFPGTHSVLWEQACATGLPCVFKDWEGGFNHVDIGGNCVLMKNVTSDSLAQMLLNIIDDKDLFSKMKYVAENKCRKFFSYIEIAKKSIEID